jgi:RHS repeat-associated protein
VYDDLDNVKAIGFGDGNWLTNFYSTGTNRLTGVRLPSGATNALAYDSAGRLSSRVSSIGETASFTYNGNDAVTTMTDNTGTTTNLFDGAGRLYGINYPFGATVRYGFDLLGRVTAMTNKASASGSNWVTRYSYDAVGNITNVNALGQDTRYEYDRVGRRTKRVLPNGVITDWQYDWRDYVTNLVHKRFSDGQVLVSFGYVRANGGEPTRITREDGGYVELKYDAALRLTNEVYRTVGGSLVEEIAYGYDAAGNRTRFLKAGVTLTNAVSGGYRITALKNAASGATAESFAYDNGGRVTYIERGSVTNRLGYNTADQLTAVTNGAAWVSYTHDAAGRRTLSTNSSSVVRRFVTAGTPQTDLESPLLITDLSGNVQQGFVYLGRHPLLRFDATGTPVYYLEDAMGSIAALATTSGTTNASFNYDGFGNLRSAGGSTNVPTGTEGDFRFHGAWWEKGTDLHHMRAREYDQRTGRFVSRDPRKGVFQRPETFNTYAYAVNNTHVFIDPAGEFTIVEFSAGSTISTINQSLKSYALSQAKKYLKEKIFESVSTLLVDQLGDLYPPLGTVWAALKDNNVAQAGRNFESVFKQMVCGAIGADGPLSSMLWFYPGLKANGEAETPGLNCPRLSPPGFATDRFYPDFVLSEVSPTEASRTDPPGKSIFIGDFKLSGNSLYNQYVRSGPQNKREQFDAITRYARQHSYTHTAVFLTVFSGNKSKLKKVQASLGGDGLKQGVVVVVIAARKNGNFEK